MSTSLDLSKLSLMDALDFAILIEEEARQRYEMFASQLSGTDAGFNVCSMTQPFGDKIGQDNKWIEW